MNRTKLSLYIAVTLSMCATFFHYLQIDKTAILYLDIAVESSEDFAITQLFYDTGRGYNQDDSVSKPIRCNAGYSRMGYNFTYRTGADLRFDPLNGAGELRIKDVIISFFNGGIEIPVLPEAVLAANQIDAIKLIDDRVVEIKTRKQANDPSLVFKSEPLPLFLLFPVLFYLQVYLFKLFLLTFLMVSVVLNVTRMNNFLIKNKDAPEGDISHL